MQELIERLEKATGPNFALEQDIWCEVFAPDAVAIDLNFKPPPYTASIDAALTLFGDHPPRGFMLSRRSNPDMGGKDYLVSGSGRLHCAARSWPLAICIAALRHRA